MWGDTVNVISENFSSNNTKAKLEEAGWSFDGTVPSVLQIASGSGAGSATTPEFSSLVGTEATLSVSHISSGKATRTLTITGVNCKVNGNTSVDVTVNGSGSGANTSIINITNASTNSKITFSAESGQGTKITNVVVSYTTTSSSPLDYISLSGTYPTIFDYNAEFSHAGMTVTATYENGETNDVTSKASFSGYNMTSAGNQTVTVSYTENKVTKTTTYDITVNPYTQPTTVTIQMTNSLFGEEVHTSGKSTEDMSFSGTQDGVTVTYNVPNDSYYYFNTSNTRPYNTCTLEYAAPTGYVIKKIVFTSDGSNWETATPSVGKMTASKQWEGVAGSVTFSWETSGTRIKTVVVSLAVPTVITLNASGFATYSAGTDFLYVGADAYTMALDMSAGTLVGSVLEAATKIPAGAGILFKGEAGATVSLVNTEDASALAASNSLLGTTDDDGNLVSVPTGKSIYVLSGNTFKPYTGTTFAANKAYFAVDKPGESRSFSMSFDDETTGISAVENTKTEVKDHVYYNLNGQRVANPGKGLYIVNGKKVIMK